MPINLTELLERVASAELAELMSIWRARQTEEWSHSVEIYRTLGDRILGQGEPLLAYDVIRQGLNIWPDDVRLRQLQGLALARSGAAERARIVLEKLRSEGQTDEETLGMLGRTFKDLASTAASRNDRQRFLKRAAETYGEAYRATGGYWSGINAATTALLVGETEFARETASRVHEQCFKELKKPGDDQYWKLAALGETALILRDLAGAEEWYAQAASEGKNRFGDLQSSRRNARLILQHWKQNPNWIDKYLRIPSVVVFSGHMIDRPDRPKPRFPVQFEEAIAQGIQRKIDELDPGFGFSSAACGSDILFLEAMLNRGAEVSIVLPFNEEEFVRDSVDFIPNSNWQERFDRVMKRASRVITASNQRLEIGGISYEFCNQLLLGLATIRARQLHTKVVPLVVWDGRVGDGPGGAASAVEHWRNAGCQPEIVDLPQVAAVAEHRPRQRRIPIVHRLPQQQFASRMAAILFADAVGFSKLKETQVPQFFKHFLGAIARLQKKFGDLVLAKNTWGDGLYFVFSDVDAAGRFALELAEFVATTDWAKKGLDAGLSLRIALHAGPVYELDDPITGRRTYTGTHVSRAARIEPITPAGQVYASEAFAALTAAQRVRNFVCDYVGQTPMAKGYGSLPTYHVRRASATSR